MFGTSLARMSSIVAALWLVLGTLVSPLPTAIAENPVAKPLYREGRGSPDGIGKFYQGREIAAVIRQVKRVKVRALNFLREEIHLPQSAGAHRP